MHTTKLRSQSETDCILYDPNTEHYGKGKTIEGVKIPVVAGSSRGGGMRRQSTEDFGAVELLCVILS